MWCKATFTLRMIKSKNGLFRCLARGSNVSCHTTASQAGLFVVTATPGHLVLSGLGTVELIATCCIPLGFGCGLKGLAGVKCIAMGLEVQNQTLWSVLGSSLLPLLSSSSVLSAAALPFLSSPALYHSIILSVLSLFCLSLTISLPHSFQVWLFISGYVDFVSRYAFGLFEHLREFDLIGIQPVYSLTITYSCTYSFELYITFSFNDTCSSEAYRLLY